MTMLRKLNWVKLGRDKVEEPKGSERPFSPWEGAMDSPLLKKLVQFSEFSESDQRLSNELTSERQQHYGRREDIIREGEHSDDIHVVLTGLACRYKILEDGSRQMMVFLVPGDPCAPRYSSWIKWTIPSAPWLPVWSLQSQVLA
jgi:hypothetical protein